MADIKVEFTDIQVLLFKVYWRVEHISAGYHYLILFMTI